MDILINAAAAHPRIVTFLIALLPVVELRGAIPIGVGLGLSHIEAMLLSIVGNMVPVPFIILFARSVFAWLRVKIPRLSGFVSRLEARAEKKKKTVARWSLLGLVLLVAVPIPGTGAWTGAMVAAIMDIRLKKAIPAIATGVVIAGLLVMGITYGFTSIF